MVIYEAFFLDYESIELLKEHENNRLEKRIEHVHCTFKYCPTKNEIINFNEIVGQDYKFKVIGYGSNENNSGFLLEFPRELEEYYTNVDPDTGKLKALHVTTSISSNAKPAWTKDLDFVPIEPFYISGKFGYFVNENGSSFVLYDSANTDAKAFRK